MSQHQRSLNGALFHRYTKALSIAFCFGVLAILPKAGEAGGVCVIAKEMGNSLAYEYVAKYGITLQTAINKAKQLLRQKGYTRRKLLDLHVQARTAIPHGLLVIVRTNYTTRTGRNRTSYGCGFSPISYTDAERRALSNLRSYSWGWNPDHDYEVIEKSAF